MEHYNQQERQEKLWNQFQQVFETAHEWRGIISEKIICTDEYKIKLLELKKNTRKAQEGLICLARQYILDGRLPVRANTIINQEAAAISFGTEIDETKTVLQLARKGHRFAIRMNDRVLKESDFIEAEIALSRCYLAGKAALGEYQSTILKAEKNSRYDGRRNDKKGKISRFVEIRKTTPSDVAAFEKMWEEKCSPVANYTDKAQYLNDCRAWKSRNKEEIKNLIIVQETENHDR